MAVVSVSLPESLLERADGFIQHRGYSGRSELVRAALRDFLNRETELEREGERNGTLTLIYPQAQERKIGEIRHEFTDVVQSMMHGHSDGSCVDVFMLKGDGQRIRAFVDALRGARGTQLVHPTYTDVLQGSEP